MTDTEILDELLGCIARMEEVRVDTIACGDIVSEYWQGYDHAQATAEKFIVSERRAAL